VSTFRIFLQLLTNLKPIFITLLVLLPAFIPHVAEAKVTKIEPWLKQSEKVQKGKGWQGDRYKLRFATLDGSRCKISATQDGGYNVRPIFTSATAGKNGAWSSEIIWEQSDENEAWDVLLDLNIICTGGTITPGKNSTQITRKTDKDNSSNSDSPRCCTIKKVTFKDSISTSGTHPQYVYNEATRKIQLLEVYLRRYPEIRKIYQFRGANPTSFITVTPDEIRGLRSYAYLDWKTSWVDFFLTPHIKVAGELGQGGYADPILIGIGNEGRSRDFDQECNYKRNTRCKFEIARSIDLEIRPVLNSKFLYYYLANKSEGHLTKLNTGAKIVFTHPESEESQKPSTYGTGQIWIYTSSYIDSSVENLTIHEIMAARNREYWVARQVENLDKPPALDTNMIAAENYVVDLEDDPKNPPVTVENLKPSAYFSWRETEDLTIELDASDAVDLDGSITEWQWTIESNPDSYGPTASANFPNKGAYEVTLKTTDNEGAISEFSKRALVGLEPPVVTLSASSLPDYQIRLDADVTSADGNIELYRFEVYDIDNALLNSGTVNAGDAPNFVFTLPGEGDYSLQLEVVDEYGLKTSKSLSYSQEKLPFDLIFRARDNGDNSILLDATLTQRYENIRSLSWKAWDTRYGEFYAIEEKRSSAEAFRLPVDSSGDYIVEVEGYDNDGTRAVAREELRVTGAGLPDDTDEIRYTFGAGEYGAIIRESTNLKQDIESGVCITDQNEDYHYRNVWCIKDGNISQASRTRTYELYLDVSKPSSYQAEHLWEGLHSRYDPYQSRDRVNIDYSNNNLSENRLVVETDISSDEESVSYGDISIYSLSVIPDFLADIQFNSTLLSRGVCELITDSEVECDITDSDFFNDVAFSTQQDSLSLIGKLQNAQSVWSLSDGQEVIWDTGNTVQGTSVLAERPILKLMTTGEYTLTHSIRTPTGQDILSDRMTIRLTDGKGNFNQAITYLDREQNVTTALSGTIKGVRSLIHPPVINGPVSSGSDLEFVRIGESANLASDVLIGEDVSFSSAEAIPPGLSLNAIKSIALKDQGGSPLRSGNLLLPYVPDLEMTLYASEVTLLEQMQLAENLFEIGSWKDYGNFELHSDNNIMLSFFPMNITRSATPVPNPGVTVSEDGIPVVTTTDGVEIHLAPTIQNFDSLEDAAIRENVLIEVKTDGNIEVSREGLILEVFRPALFSIQGPWAGEYQKIYRENGWNPSDYQFSAILTKPHPVSETLALRKFIHPPHRETSYDGYYGREQELLPVPLDWPSLKTTLSQIEGLDSVWMTTDGVIKVKLGEYVMSAVMDYALTPVNSSNRLNIFATSDRNGDGIADVMVQYPQGYEQVMYIFP